MAGRSSTKRPLISVDGQEVPDLVSHEIPFYRAVEQFNRTARATQIVFVNQFGWSQDRCGQRMPAEMDFADIRRGSDLEFGQSIYEPFGIAQLEPLSYGALCVLSNVCGCVGFVRRAGGLDTANVIVADYTQEPRQPDRRSDIQPPWPSTRHAAIRSRPPKPSLVAAQIAARLPQDERAAAKLHPSRLCPEPEDELAGRRPGIPLARTGTGTASSTSRTSI